MKLKWFILPVAFLFSFSHLANAEVGFVIDAPPGPTVTPAVAAKPKDTSFRPGKTYFEMGAILGFPIGMGFQLGVWNVGGSALLLRYAAGLGILDFSHEGEIGWIFDPNGDFKQYFSFNLGRIFTVSPLIATSLTDFQTSYAGVQYGFTAWNLITFSGGFAYVSRNTKGIYPQGKIGISWFF